MSKNPKTNFLKLDFNERSDKFSEVAKNYDFGDTLWRYPERQILEKQIADLNQLKASQVFCTNGGDEAIMLLMRIIKEESLNEKGTSMILPLPAFSQYTWGINSWGIDCNRIYQNTDLSINTAAIIQSIKKNTHAVTIITRPNNPTGEVIDLDSLKNIIKVSQDNSGWIFLDEAYIEFSGEENIACSRELLNQFDNLIILRTFSKAYGLAGIRLGYLLGNPSLLKKFTQRCIPFNVPQPSLQIASQALQQENRLEVNQYCEKIIQNRNALYSWLSQSNINVLPSQANFFILQLPNQQAQTIKSFLEKNKILVRDFENDDLKNCLRITIPFNLDKLLPLLEQCLTPGLICMDMDGVLIDTSRSYDETIKATVKLISGKTVKQRSIEQLKDTGGYNNDWLVTQKLLQNLGCESSLDEVTEKFQELYLGKNNNGFVANEKPLIQPSLVTKIKQSKNTVFSIVTGRPRKEANSGKLLINLADLDLISLDDVEQPKPSPEGVEKLKTKYSTLSWMCGDNPDDMQCAVASNSLAIGIGKRNARILYQAGADIVLNNINELEAWLCPIK